MFQASGKSPAIRTPASRPAPIPLLAPRMAPRRDGTSIPTLERFRELVEKSSAREELIVERRAPYSRRELAELERRLGFTRDGHGQMRGLLSGPWRRVPGLVGARVAAGEDVAREFAESRLAGDNPPDAYRHANLAIRLSRASDPAHARRILDGHERDRAGKETSRAMDLINNHNGMVLSRLFPNIRPDVLARLALDAGYLVRRPPEIAD